MQKRTLQDVQRAYLRRVLSETGMTPTKLAREIKVDPSTLTRFLNNPGHKNNLSATTLDGIEGLTGLKAPLPTGANQVGPRVKFVGVLGIAAAGAWYDVKLAGNESVESIPVGPLPKYDGKTQYALRIQGESINRKASDGSYAICVAWDELGLASPPEGKFVHVQRTHGGLVEVTIKQVHVIRGQTQLRPYSTDPRHQESLSLDHPDDDTEVTIKGLVIGWFSHDD